MATIKAYTDLQQSRKLAEILPLESADMYYEEVCNLPKVIVGNYILHNQCMEDKDYKKLSNPVLSPAWSLAALLGIIPQEIFDGEYTINITEGLDNKWIISYNADNSASFYGLIASADNLLDACVDMVIKLSERKMIQL